MTTHRFNVKNYVKCSIPKRNFSTLTIILPKHRCLSDNVFNVKAGKMKTRKAVSKRFRVTGAERIIRSQCGKKHLNEKKTRTRKNNLAAYKILAKSEAKNISICLPYL